MYTYILTETRLFYKSSELENKSLASSQCYIWSLEPYPANKFFAGDINCPQCIARSEIHYSLKAPFVRYQSRKNQWDICQSLRAVSAAFQLHFQLHGEVEKQPCTLPSCCCKAMVEPHVVLRSNTSQTSLIYASFQLCSEPLTVLYVGMIPSWIKSPGVIMGQHWETTQWWTGLSHTALQLIL